MLVSLRGVGACLLAGAAALAGASETASHTPPVVAAKAAPAEGAHAAPPAGHAAPAAPIAKVDAKTEVRPAAHAVAESPAAAHKPQVLEPSIRPLAPLAKAGHQVVPVTHPPSAYAKPAHKPVAAKPRSRPQHEHDITAAAAPDALARPLAAAGALSARLAGHDPAAHDAPRAVVLACSDGAARNRLVGKGAQALYVVQNRGNQLPLGEPAITYAVRQLRTPLLMVVAQDDCRAVDVARGDFTRLPAAERDELLGIHIDKEIPLREAQLANLDNQVESAMLLYGGDVDAGRLTVIGAYYDAAGSLGQGRGRLVVTSINGEQDKRKIAAMLRHGKLAQATEAEAGDAPQHAPAGGH